MILQKKETEVGTNLKSMMALAINFPRKRNFILILAMCAGFVVLPKGTANSPLELNMYLVPSWFPEGERSECHRQHNYTTRIKKQTDSNKMLSNE